MTENSNEKNIKNSFWRVIKIVWGFLCAIVDVLHAIVTKSKVITLLLILLSIAGIIFPEKIIEIREWVFNREPHFVVEMDSTITVENDKLLDLNGFWQLLSKQYAQFWAGHSDKYLINLSVGKRTLQIPVTAQIHQFNHDAAGTTYCEVLILMDPAFPGLWGIARSSVGPTCKYCIGNRVYINNTGSAPANSVKAKICVDGFVSRDTWLNAGKDCVRSYDDSCIELGAEIIYQNQRIDCDFQAVNSTKFKQTEKEWVFSRINKFQFEYEGKSIPDQDLIQRVHYVIPNCKINRSMTLIR